MRVLGIDPGLRRLGWGVVDFEPGLVRHVGNGTIVTESGPTSARLQKLFFGLSEVVSRFAPGAAAVEEVFVNNNPRKSLKLGQARGIALLAPAVAGLEVAEYTPNKIKKSVAGVGLAQKEQMIHMIRMLLPGAMVETSDAADALAVAICHANHMQGKSRLEEAIERAGC